MNTNPWVLFDTETNGLSAPIFVVEIGAQRMRGWTPEGPPFRRLLNQNVEIPPETSRVHGYTREILERDGEPAVDVYRDFSAYVEDRPLVAYNLPYDLDEVLLPEWERLGIPIIGQRGFCALRLAQRLLDPVPAGNCKLQTLRQFYRLPEHGAHTAMGDVETVADLLDQVLRPIATQRGLLTWDAIVEFTEAVWFPSRIAFGKFKGRDFREAAKDSGLRGWLEWLAGSTNGRSSRMGRWYLDRLDALDATVSGAVFADASSASGVTGTGVVFFVDPEIEDLKRMVDAARTRLADLEAEYTRERHAVDVTQSRLFERLREHYQRRDRLKLVIDYREKFVETLLRSGEDDAEQVAEEYSQARQKSDDEYKRAAADAEDSRELSEDEQTELQSLWRKLVRLFHPDRFVQDPEKQRAYGLLVTEINRARDSGDIERLKEIAEDPNGFMFRHRLGWLDFKDALEARHLRSLLDSLQIRIVELLETLATFRESGGYELHTLVSKRPEYLEAIVAEHVQAIETEIRQMEKRAQALAEDIEMLTGAAGPGFA